MRNEQKTCKSCDGTFEDSFRFCPKCGGELSLVTAPEPSTTEAVAVPAITSEQPTLSARSAPRAHEGAMTADADGFFQMTFVEERNSKVKNGLLLASLTLVVVVFFASIVYSMFAMPLNLESIELEEISALVEDLEPVQVDEIEPEKDDEKEGGGGGGGGKEQERDASAGRLPSQSQNPINPPSPLPQLTNPSLPVVMETKGNNERPITPEVIGIPGGLDGLPSSGRGSGGGIGDGDGTGAGTGRGTGEGGGIGSGSGNGRGDGDGDGDGDGGRPPAIRTGPTAGVKIVSKPRASYTDSARQQGVQGKVVLRVTFEASGQIGAVAPVSGLPAGLTERAIAAARSIRFEPAMRNGTPYTVTRTVEYSFTLY